MPDDHVNFSGSSAATEEDVERLQKQIDELEERVRELEEQIDD